MSWQRIDEHTSIDDTLVTCAEYQLFIDEMREQGKYYQPDHWTSYQFPEGQAREPILGVRHSDAVTFCEWLSQREDGKAKYRLPTSKEATGFPLIKTFNKELMGYWLDKDFEFAWINPEDTKHAEVDKNIPSERKEYSARTRAVIIDGGAFTPLGNTSTTKIIDELRVAIDNIRNLEFDRNDHIRIARQFSSELSQKRANTYESFTSDDLFQEDFLILRERIAGRYPPYEGIRLVKVTLV